MVGQEGTSRAPDGAVVGRAGSHQPAQNLDHPYPRNPRLRRPRLGGASGGNKPIAGGLIQVRRHLDEELEGLQHMRRSLESARQEIQDLNKDMSRKDSQIEELQNIRLTPSSYDFANAASSTDCLHRVASLRNVILRNKVFAFARDMAEYLRSKLYGDEETCRQNATNTTTHPVDAITSNLASISLCDDPDENSSAPVGVRMHVHDDVINVVIAKEKADLLLTLLENVVCDPDADEGEEQKLVPVRSVHSGMTQEQIDGLLEDYKHLRVKHNDVTARYNKLIYKTGVLQRSFRHSEETNNLLQHYYQSEKMNNAVKNDGILFRIWGHMMVGLVAHVLVIKVVKGIF